MASDTCKELAKSSIFRGVARIDGLMGSALKEKATDRMLRATTIKMSFINTSCWSQNALIKLDQMTQPK